MKIFLFRPNHGHLKQIRYKNYVSYFRFNLLSKNQSEVLLMGFMECYPIPIKRSYYPISIQGKLKIPLVWIKKMKKFLPF